MKSAFLHELMGRRSEIAQRWRAALQDIPVHTALGNPDTLAFMIEPTLTELFRTAFERPSPSWMPQSPPKVRLVESASRCALNPMIGYYLAGEAAVAFTVHGIMPRDDLSESDILISEGKLLALLRHLGRAEVTSFCEICLIETPSKATTRADATVPATCPFKAHKPGSAAAAT